MWRRLLEVYGSIAFVTACGGHPSSGEHRSTASTGRPDASSIDAGTERARDAGSVDAQDAHPEASRDTAAETSLPYDNSACPSAFAAPLADPERNDDGRLGLAALYARIHASRQEWERYSAAHGDTYNYSRVFSSFTGYTCEEVVEVTRGVVTSSRSTSDPNCFLPVTMDALYDECENDVLCQDPRDNWLYVRVDSRGLMAECDYFPRNCSDDCFSGVTPLSLPAEVDAGSAKVDAGSIPAEAGP
jgi:hypothetical protein